METATRKTTMARIEKVGKTEHPDFFDSILPPGEEVPGAAEKSQSTHLGSLGLQMMFANWGPMADWWYGTLLYLLDEPECYDQLVREIRTTLTSYDKIDSGSLASLPFLHACLEETLRLLPTNLTGLPWYSPGAVVDDHFIPKGVRKLSFLQSFYQNSSFFQKSVC